ncbi:MAG: hypothetical protein AB7F74_11560 [Parvibaculaceae bacterium]
MPKAYFEPENMRALTLVFSEVLEILQSRGTTDSRELDRVAERILYLASKGVSPAYILADVLRTQRTRFEVPIERMLDAKIQTTLDAPAEAYAVPAIRASARSQRKSRRSVCHKSEGSILRRR